MRYYIFLIVVLFLSFNCKSNIRIEEENFVQIYADLLIAKEIYRGNDTAFIKARDSIYNKYNVNNFMVQKTLEYYNSDTEKWKQFFEKVIRRLEEQQTQIKMSN
ncbi:MAG: DUF4296 domain-containing protein [Ignavibacteria bacterium]|nr:DUF4296 domain-containing protein [Ignavibacteria bacterium]